MAAGVAAGIETGVCVLQSQSQFHVQLQVHVCCQLSDQVDPSVRTQVQFQVQRPEGAVVAVEVPGAGTGATFCQIQFQIEPASEAAVGLLPSVGGAQSPSQLQFHCHEPSVGTEGARGSTTEMARLVPGVTVTMLPAGLVPVAVAPLT